MGNDLTASSRNQNPIQSGLEPRLDNRPDWAHVTGPNQNGARTPTALEADPSTDLELEQLLVVDVETGTSAQPLAIVVERLEVTDA